MHTATPRQKGITDNFVKIELLPIAGPEWQYLPIGTVKCISLLFFTLKNSV